MSKEEKQGNNERCLQEAMERLDTALTFMGCPGEVARPFVRMRGEINVSKGENIQCSSNIKKQKYTCQAQSHL